MKSLTNGLLATVALVAAAGSALAQTSLKAEIPFSFQAGAKMMAPGTYRVMPSWGVTPLIQLSNQSDRQSALLLVEFRDASKEWRKARVPKLAFECIEGHCSLAKVWTGDRRDAMEIRGRRPVARDAAGLTIITLDLKAE